jgi:hypothetical protein
MHDPLAWMPASPMGQTCFPSPVLLIIAAFSRHEEALSWAEEKLTVQFGPIGRRSPDFDFHQTHYYESSMGTGLRKRFLVFRDLVPPDRLADIKVYTNQLEEELARSARLPEPRPLNLDPGILSQGKFMLATTKDQAHRVYLQGGIYAEVTLRFQSHAYHPNPWTYADYREPALLDFLNEARDYYRQRLREETRMEDGASRIED